jgi:hypothetical protein
LHRHRKCTCRTSLTWYTLADYDWYTLADCDWYSLADAAWYIIVRLLTVGTPFPSRAAMSEAGVHRPLLTGIAGGEGEGAESIVLAGGYEDDQDYGAEITYTRHGDTDPSTE